MHEHLESLKTYIRQQLRSGMHPDDIAAQLRTVQWPEDLIGQAFYAVQSEMLPTDFSPGRAAPLQSTNGPQSTPVRRGRLRTGWALFKQSLTLLRGNRYLLRYLMMTGVWVLGINAVLVTLYLSFYTSFNNTRAVEWALTILDYIVIYFFTNLYAAGLTANVLDLFQGNRKSYREYMQMAWSKAPAIFVFSLISATVGLFLEYVVERIRWVGWLLAWLLGVVWSLGTSFVIPIIMTSKKPSGVTSIRTSMRFFKQTWGENIAAKVSVNAPLFLINCAFIIVLVFAFVPCAQLFGIWGVYILFGLYVTATISLAVVGSFATSLVNIALFYFAVYHTAPPAFSEDLLNSIFIQRKPRRFGKNKAPKATA